MVCLAGRRDPRWSQHRDGTQGRTCQVGPEPDHTHQSRCDRPCREGTARRQGACQTHPGRCRLPRLAAIEAERLARLRQVTVATAAGQYKAAALSLRALLIALGRHASGSVQPGKGDFQSSSSGHPARLFQAKLIQAITDETVAATPMSCAESSSLTKFNPITSATSIVAASEVTLSITTLARALASASKGKSRRLN